MLLSALLRLVLVLNLLLVTRFALAQQRYQDPEPEAPRVYAADVPAVAALPLPDPALQARHAELVRYFTRTLALQPHQAQAVRRALSLTVLQQLPATPAEAPEVSPLDEVRLLLSAQQLSQLQQLTDSPVPAPELKWLAVTR